MCSWVSAFILRLDVAVVYGSLLQSAVVYL